MRDGYDDTDDQNCGQSADMGLCFHAVSSHVSYGNVKQTVERAEQDPQRQGGKTGNSHFFC
jgi:hypothetical protein